MSGLFHTLNIGSESLFAARQGVDTTGHNIANAQTEGYSRQRVEIHQRAPSWRHGLIMGNGAYAGAIKRSHDQFLERQVNRHGADYGYSQAMNEAMASVETLFSPELSASIAEDMSTFFNSMQDLSAFPEDSTARLSVREMAITLGNSFRRIDGDLRDLQSQFDGLVQQEADEITSIASNIASLNQKIRTLEVGTKQDANDLLDQRDLLVRTLAEKVDLTYYTDKNNMVVVRGPGQELLVEGNHASRLSVRKDVKTGHHMVQITDFENSITKDVTHLVRGGSLSGYIDVRDRIVGGLIQQQNDLASNLVTEVNSIHNKGFGLGDYKMQQGRNFFAPITDLSRAAADMDIASEVMQSTDAISAGLVPDTPGDNVIINELISLKDKKVFDGRANFNDFYANFVGELGIEKARIQSKFSADQVLRNELQQKRESISGVSLDEEATNLMKWQTAFTASSKLITTVDEMLQTVLNLKR